MARKAQIIKSRRSLVNPKFSTRIVRRCWRCGRKAGYMRDFKSCRICFRELANRGDIPEFRNRAGKPMITDPIADMLTIIRNALTARKETARIPHSKMREKICHILVKEKYLTACEIIEEADRKFLDVTLRYMEDGRPSITTIRRISTPGRRVYVGRRELPVVLNHFGIAILSTSQGMMTNREARKTAVGGEIICEVY